MTLPALLGGCDDASQTPGLDLDDRDTLVDTGGPGDAPHDSEPETSADVPEPDDTAQHDARDSNAADTALDAADDRDGDDTRDAVTDGSDTFADVSTDADAAAHDTSDGDDADSGMMGMMCSGHLPADISGRESCNDAPLVTGAGVHRFASASSAYLQDDIKLSGAGCTRAGDDEAELVFRVDLQRDQALYVREVSSRFEASLHLQQGQCGSSIACHLNADDDEGLVYRATAQETVFVVVELERDGVVEETDGYELELEVVDVVCGNGVLEPGEACDDGNMVADDVCNLMCEVNPGGCASPALLPTFPYIVDLAAWSSVTDDQSLDGLNCRLLEPGVAAELVMAVDLLAGESVFVAELAPDLETTLSIQSGSCGDMTPCAASSDRLDEADGLSYRASTDETVYVIVESDRYADVDSSARVRVDRLSTTTTCGNGALDPGEACDDGNTNVGDGCSAVCQREGEHCGDPVVVDTTMLPFAFTSMPWRQLDDDHAVAFGSGCAITRYVSELVFQVDVPAGQTLHVVQQDPGFNARISVMKGVCTDAGTCETETSSTNLLRPDELFYTSATDETVYVFVESSQESRPAELVFDVLPPGCGNGAVEPGEACDDGNPTSGDGCSASCSLEGESCAAPVVVTSFPFELEVPSFYELNNDHTLTGPGCAASPPSDRELVYQIDLLAGESLMFTNVDDEDDVDLAILTGGCGDDAVCAATDADTSDASGAIYTATTAETVYAVVEASLDQAHLRLDRRVVICGDGVIEGAEQCDDGNVLDGDGCAADCTLEGESCAAPAVLTQPITRVVGRSWLDVEDDLDLDSALDCESNGTGDGELVYQVTLAPGESVSARVPAPGWSGDVSLQRGSCGLAVACQTSTRHDDTGISYRNLTGASETVFLIFEANASSEADPFELAIEISSPVCGDGQREPGEDCDDGNTIDGDLCSATCEFEGEHCNDPIVVAGTGLRLTGASWLGVRDDHVPGTGCLANGDHAPELVFQIDLVAGQSLVARETAFGAVHLNLVLGDCDTGACIDAVGSSNGRSLAYTAPADETLYLIADMWAHYDEPFEFQIDLVTPVCGDGVLQLGEACDDGNLVDTDACDSTCALRDTTCAMPALIGTATYRIQGQDWSTIVDDQYFETATCGRVQGVDPGELVLAVELEACEGVRLTSPHPSFEPALNILQDQCDNTAPCLVNATGNGAETELVAPMAGTYYLTVEAQAIAPDEVPFDLRVERFTVEVCDDGVDNDRDGLVDCDDVDCSGLLGCAAAELNCVDGVDNDGDLQRDCADIDCATSHGCQPADGFREYSGLTDLIEMRIVYTPDGAGSYGFHVEPAAALETAPGSGDVRSEQLHLYADQSEAWAAALELPFFGASYRTVFVSANGYVTFGRPDPEFNVFDHEFYAYPRISTVDNRSDPQRGGSITVDEFADRLVVTWQQVMTQFTGSRTVTTSQLEVRANGEIRVTILDNQHGSRNTGISSGGRGDAWPPPTDFVPEPTP